MPHARVTHIDTSGALAMPGVKAILTANDLPGPVAGATLGENVVSTAQGERPLTMEPVYEGEPILALAAVDEYTAAEAIEKIVIEFAPLPFSVDPVESLRPGSPNARLQGNTWMRPAAPTGAPAAGRGGAAAASAAPRRPVIGVVKWTEADFAKAGEGQLPMGQPTDEWTFGDIEAGFKEAEASGGIVLDETFVGQSTGHQPLETRTAMAYWQNGKLYAHVSTQSTVQTVAALARGVGIDPTDVVLISEYTGGGFGSKIPGSLSMAIPALLSKKANAPVMMRVTREEEHYIGRARPM
jgi:CO/xanthine dehydrogenase Mo-binding subunit